MDVLKRLAKEFSSDFHKLGYDFETFDSALNSKLLYINKTSEKLRFLSYLKDIAETELKEHAPKCDDPERCSTSLSLANVLYSLNQQYQDYIEIEGDFNTSEKPAMKFFTEGQYFDAFTSIREIIKEAKDSIVLIDGYVNADTLAFFPGKDPMIKLRILTDKKSLGAEFQRAINLYNKQYENLQIETSKNFHDRFIIIDNNQFYHIGASIKDAGNKTFMYTKIEDEDVNNTIRKKINQEWSTIYE